jgi:hypothetical protein
LSITVKVKYAGTQQHPTAITIEVAFEIKVTMITKTSKAITIALGLTFAVFSMKEKLGLLSKLSRCKIFTN